ncbi:MAG: hypothetical protein WDZ29_04435 [Balneolaceae bacterium]
MGKARRDEVEHDALIEYSSRALYFYRQNRAAIIGVCLLVVGIIGFAIFLIFNSNQQQERSQQLLGVAEQYYFEGDLQRALYGDEDAMTLGFIQIADNFQRTQSGNLANYYASAVLYDLENYQEALEYIDRFDPPEGILGVGSISLKAVILSELGRHREAADTFLRAAEWNENSLTTPQHMLEAAGAYNVAGEPERSRELLGELLRLYPNSPQADNARKLQGTLAVR